MSIRKVNWFRFQSNVKIDNWLLIDNWFFNLNINDNQYYEILVAICDLQHKRGPCNENHDRYYYDVDAHKCNHFNWGGCEPNKNNFKTRNECEHACLRLGMISHIMYLSWSIY